MEAHQAVGLILFNIFYSFQKISNNYGNSCVLNTDYISGFMKEPLHHLLIVAITQFYRIGNLRPKEVINNFPQII